MIESYECPSCKADLSGEDIVQSFLSLGFSEEDALEKASGYGWTKENPKRFSRRINIYSREMDRTTHYYCPDCKHQWKR